MEDSLRNCPSGNSVTIAIMGHVSVGKTTFVNALCNKKLLPTTSDENTQIFTNIKHNARLESSELYYENRCIISGNEKIYKCIKELNENNLDCIPKEFIVDNDNNDNNIVNEGFVMSEKNIKNLAVEIHTDLEHLDGKNIEL